MTDSHGRPRPPSKRLPIAMPLSNEPHRLVYDKFGNLISLIVWADEFIEAMNICWAISSTDIDKLPIDLQKRIAKMLNTVEGKDGHR